MEMSAAGGLRLRVTSGTVPAAGRAWLQPPASHLGNGAVNWHLPPNAFRQLRVSCKPPPRGVHLCGSIRSPDGCFPEMRREGVARSWGSWCLTPTACPQQPQLLSGRLFGDPPHDGSHGIQHCQWDGRGEVGWLVVQSSREGNQGSVPSSRGAPSLKPSAGNTTAARSPHPRHRCGGTGRCHPHGGWHIPATIWVALGSRQRPGGPGHVAVQGWLCPCTEPGLAAAAPCGAVIDARSRLAPSINTYTF